MKNTFSFLFRTRGWKRFLFIIFSPFLYNMYLLFTSPGYAVRFDGCFGARTPGLVFSIALSIILPVAIILFIVMVRMVAINLRIIK